MVTLQKGYLHEPENRLQNIHVQCMYMYVCVTQCKQTEKENHALFLENASITFVLKCSVCLILIIPWQTVAFENAFQM